MEKMKVLIDTNILIQREDIKPVPSGVDRLVQVLQREGVQILIHPLCAEEIKRDRNAERRQIVLSKIRCYPLLESPPCAGRDREFMQTVGRSTSSRDKVDMELLYSLYRNAVSFLITQDKELKKKAIRLRLDARVFSVSDALAYFDRPSSLPAVPLAINRRPAYAIDNQQDIFLPLKKSYPDFEKWWTKISREGRPVWVYERDERLGAVLILKDEMEEIKCSPPLPERKRVKICTLIVSPENRGLKIGELFLKIALHYAHDKGAEEVYLTHFTEHREDYLVDLLEEFGFEKVGRMDYSGEDVFLKRTRPSDPEIASLSPSLIYRSYYPHFYDGQRVKKFIVPIKPRWHNRLFPESRPRQLELEEVSVPITEGNTIKKAYLCHSRLKNMNEGDILLFYRSGHDAAVTNLGVIEVVHDGVTDPNVAISLAGKRTVYSPQEISVIMTRPTKIILFWWMLQLPRPVSRVALLRKGCLTSPPRSILEINEDCYSFVKQEGGIHEKRCTLA